jgi:hypothetical protein
LLLLLLIRRCFYSVGCMRAAVRAANTRRIHRCCRMSSSVANAT